MITASFQSASTMYQRIPLQRTPGAAARNGRRARPGRNSSFASGRRHAFGRECWAIIVTSSPARRINPYGLLGLSEGDAHVIRNAGAWSPRMRSARSRSRRTCWERRRSSSSTTPTAGCLPSPTMSSPRGSSWRPPSGRSGALRPFRTLVQDLRDGIERIKSSPFIPPTDSVRGFIYEVETGRLRKVS